MTQTFRHAPYLRIAAVNTTSSRNPSERPTRLLPGALLPAPWLAGGLLQDALPGVRAALARGTLQMQTLTLSPGTDWAHDRWLRQHPALAPLQLPDGAMAAVQALAGAQSAGVAAGRQMHDTALEHGHAGNPPAAAEASASHEAPCWLIQPVTFRLTTDAMLVDTRPQALVDEPLARRLVEAMSPLLAERGHAVTLLDATRWLVTPLPGAGSWQLQCTPLETAGEQHVDALMPEGPDDRRFRQLLNEIQMTWHQLNLHEPHDLPVNGVWLNGPARPEAARALQGLVAQGLQTDTRFLAPRVQQDLGAWLDALPVLDDWLAADPAHFSCLLAGAQEVHWLHATGLPAAMTSMVPFPARAITPADTGAASRQATAGGLLSRLVRWLMDRRGDHRGTPSATGRPAGGATAGRKGAEDPATPGMDHDALSVLFRDEAP